MTPTTPPSGPDTHLHDLPILDRMRDCRVPGVSVAVIEGGQVVEQRAYGVRAAGHDSPVTETTRFQACSISKPVTVMAMLRLVEQGVLDLDADVNDTLRTWRVPANGGWQPRVTLRQLASHSAGLTTHGFPGYHRDADLPGLVQVLTGTSPANTEGVRVDIFPGVQFRYSGGGTTVLQLVLEEVTQTPVADLIRTLVLDPLGMEHSGYEQPLPEALEGEAATAHTRDGRPVPGGWHVYPEQCAAGLWTTPTDLARFAIAIQRAAAGADGALVSPATAEELLTPQSPPSANAERIGGLNAVGLGPFLCWDDGTVTYFGHSGGNEGFRCHLLAHRDRGTGAAVMTNADGAMPVIIEAFDAIATAGGWEGYRTEPLEDLPPSDAGLDGFTGSFLAESGLHVEVTRDGDRLDVVVGDQAVVPFSAYQAKAIASQFVDAILTLSDDGLVLRQSGGETVCRRVG
jgi:CubicO group peptidase (beta-lactamase class C family)